MFDPNGLAGAAMSQSVQTPLWVSYLIAFGPLIVAALVGYIAYRQWRTAHARLRLDLFSRRFEIYEGYRSFVAKIMADGGVRVITTPEFHKARQEVDFFFGNDVTNRLGSFAKRASRAWALRKEFKDLAQGEERSRLVREESNERTNIYGEFQENIKIFQKYMKIPEK